MKERIEHFLTAVLILLILPCALTYLLSGRMEELYRTIQNETEEIMLKMSSGTLELSPEEYVIGVTAAQIPFSYDLEAVKAQMVAVRTNLYRQVEKEGTIDDQGFVSMKELEQAGVAEKFLRAQKETNGKILTWQGEPLMASFHAVSTGKTRNGNETLGSDQYPYLVSKVCPSDEKAEKFMQVIQIDPSWKDLEILERDDAGYVLQIRAKQETMSGEAFRSLLGLPSASFDVEQDGMNVILVVKGVGHGLGMSQYTAQQMALTGKNYTEILSYFYQDALLDMR